MGAGTDSNSEQTDGNRPVEVLAVILLACAGASIFLVEPLFLGTAADAMGLSHGQTGLLAGIELTGTAIGSVAAVFWIRHVNWRTAAYFSLGIIISGNFLSGTTDQLNDLFVIRFLTGLLGESTTLGIALMLISRMHNTDKLFGLVIASEVGLSVLAMLFIPGLIETGGISGVLTPLAVFAILVLAVVPGIPVGVAERSRTDAEDETYLVFPVFLALGVLLVWSLGVGAVWAFIERIGSLAHIELAAVGTALAIGASVGLCGALLAVVAGKFWGRLPLFTLAMAGQITALLMLAKAVNWISFTLAVTLLSLSWNFALPFLLGTIAAYDKARRFIVLVIAAQGLGVAIGPLIAGHLSDRMGLAAVSYFGIVACIVSVCMLIATFVIANKSTAMVTQRH